MPSDFDFDDVDLEKVAPTKPVVTSVVEYAPAPVPEPSKTIPLPEDEEVDELTLRMTKAQYYWSLANARLLEEDDYIAAEVEAEVQGFVRERLAELMGSTAPKKRGRPAKLPEPLPQRKVASVRPAPVKRRPAAQAAPATARDAGVELTREITAPDGEKRTKVFKKFVDNESGREYYLGFDIADGKRVGDGLKYELATNAAGGTYFRTINQQTILTEAPKIGKAQYEAIVQQQAHQHAAAANAAIAKDPFGALISSAIQLAQRG